MIYIWLFCYRIFLWAGFYVISLKFFTISILLQWLKWIWVIQYTFLWLSFQRDFVILYMVSSDNVRKFKKLLLIISSLSYGVFRKPFGKWYGRCYYFSPSIVGSPLEHIVGCNYPVPLKLDAAMWLALANEMWAEVTHLTSMCKFS